MGGKMAERFVRGGPGKSIRRRERLFANTAGKV